MNKNKILVILPIILCFIYSINRLNSFYKINFPVAEPGECVKLTDKDGKHYKAMVVDNSEKFNASLINIKVSPASIVQISVRYVDLRNYYNAKRIDCNENVY